MKKKLITLAILLFTSFWVFSQSITGVYNTDYNEMTISQKGKKVTATYKYQNGHINGILSGHTLPGSWSQDNSKGKFVFDFNSDFSAFTGQWGYNNDAYNKKWNGKKK